MTQLLHYNYETGVVLNHFFFLLFFLPTHISSVQLSQKNVGQSGYLFGCWTQYMNVKQYLTFSHKLCHRVDLVQTERPLLIKEANSRGSWQKGPGT